MTVTTEKKWHAVLANLKDFLEDVNYNAWFSDLKFYKYDKASESLYLIAPIELTKAQLENRYRDIIISKSNEVMGNVRNVFFFLPEEIEKNGKKHKGSRDFDISEEGLMNPRYTFDTFVVGENNRFPYSYALYVAENAESPNPSYNPLFIYGGAGLGKTHLMCAIGHYIIDHYPDLRVRYVSSEMYTNDYVSASMASGSERTEHMNAFKAKYRNIDVLMIDDIQFIESKTRTIEEVFWTYNTLYESGKQLIFSSDRPPKDLLGLDERLQSRLSSGLIADIQPPVFETKVAILKNKAILDNIPMTDGLNEVISLIAEKIKTNVREMEGAFNRVVAYSTLSGLPINKVMARSVLHDVITQQDIVPTPDAVKKSVAAYYTIKVSDIESSKKARTFSFPRQLAMYLCKEMTNLSLKEIGNSFGGRDHTTVLYACEKINGLKTNDGNIKKILTELENVIRNN
ncbi:MAG: chromosomal replication initiator protein DnaA [Clostridiales Family XIII bacterium]|jgi:chromosomal replication initiator protein|nr:chromosomal replication initiator protein DnaA [Clostridiales Family XIII bacterium]